MDGYIYDGTNRPWIHLRNSEYNVHWPEKMQLVQEIQSRLGLYNTKGYFVNLLISSYLAQQF
jgi:hypothetical protein